MVLFGYIARMARAGTIEALDADYTRTAFLKGIPTRTVIFRHVLRNSLLPDDRRDRHADGLPDRWPGRDRDSSSTTTASATASSLAAQNKDVTMLQSGVLVIAIVYLVATLIADILYSVLNPRIRHATARMSTASRISTSSPTPAVRQDGRAARDDARARALEDVRGRNGDHPLVGLLRVLRQRDRAPRPAQPNRERARGPERAPPVRHRSARPRCALAGARRGAEHPHDRPAGDGACDRRRDEPRPRHRLLPRHRRRRRQPDHRRAPLDPADRARGRPSPCRSATRR